MYLGIDVGGTKTLVAVLNNHGVITKSEKFPTPEKYTDWTKQLAKVVANISTEEYIACGVGVPGRVNRETGVGLDMGNLPWQVIPVRSDVLRIVHCPVVV